MHWIEAWFGVSPDGGDGSLEALFVVAGAVSIAILVASLPGPTRRRLARILPGLAAKHTIR